MTNDQYLDRLSDVLKGPASTRELAAGTDVVGQMTTLTRAGLQGGSVVTGLFSKKVAAIVGVAVLGTTTAAAAATGNLPLIDEPERPVIVAAIDSGESDDAGDNAAGQAVESTESAVATAETGPVDEDGEPYGDVKCEEAENHGEYVSSVAKDDSIEGNRGQVVSEAAKTDCGKEDKGDKDKDDKDNGDKDKGDKDNGDEDKGEDADDEKSNNGKSDESNKGKNKGNKK